MTGAHLRTGALVPALCIAAFLGLAGLASAAETSRAEYVAAVEPICKTDTQADSRILHGVKAEVRAGKLKPAAARFEKAAKALGQTVRKLKAVPRPPADASRLGGWFTAIAVEQSLFEATAADPKAGRKAAAEHNSVKLTVAADKANNAVLVFGFRYCRAEPSRFM